MDGFYPILFNSINWLFWSIITRWQWLKYPMLNVPARSKYDPFWVENFPSHSSSPSGLKRDIWKWRPSGSIWNQEPAPSPQSHCAAPGMLACLAGASSVVLRVFLSGMG
ncbi:MAG: hypothetical protein IH598_09315 [Bacteroidales bacterium]|nr:hypothetical protein [Bacteroidales bacterium]